VRGDRPCAGWRSHPLARAELLSVKCTLVLGSRAPLRGGAIEREPRLVTIRTQESLRTCAGPTGDDGCTGVAEKGSSRTPLRSARTFARSPDPRHQGHR